MQLVLGTLLDSENLLLSEDNIHTQHRQLIALVFRHQTINSMISLMVEITSNFLNKRSLSIKDNPLKRINEIGTQILDLFFFYGAQFT
jgi:cytochrome P450